MNLSEPTVWSTPSNGLSLGLSRAGQELRVQLQNTGSEPLSVLSHVVAGGRPHLDWFELHLEDDAGGVRRLRFLSDRDEAAPVRVVLVPGGHLLHDIDVAHWALEPVNGKTPLGPRPYRAYAEYRVSHAEAGESWSGSLRTPMLK